METMYINKGEIHAEVNLTDEEYNKLQRLINLEKKPTAAARFIVWQEL